MTPVVKKSRAKTAAYHRLEKLFRDYLVGIDIGTIQRSDQAGEIFERLHFPVILSACLRLLPRPLAHVDEMARDGGRGRHYRAHQVGTSALALPPLEVAVRRACTSLVTSVTIPGLVPHVTCGANSAPSKVMLWSNFAPGSVLNCSQCCARRSNSAPAGT